MLLPVRVLCRFVAPLLDSRLDPRGDAPMHALVYPLPDERLDTMLDGASGPGSAGAVSRVRADVCTGVVRCVEHVHSRRVVLVRVGPANMVRYGCDWKILGLGRAHRESEMLGAIRGLWDAATAPEVVRGLKEGRAEGLKATRQMDSWSVGEMLFRVLTGEELVGQGDGAMLGQDKEGRGQGDAQLERYLERRVDRVDDVMGKYLVENLVCIDPRDRMSLRDALLYAPQIAAAALSPTGDSDSTDNMDAMADTDGADSLGGVAGGGMHDMGMRAVEHLGRRDSDGERGNGAAIDTATAEDLDEEGSRSTKRLSVTQAGREDKAALGDSGGEEAQSGSR